MLSRHDSHAALTARALRAGKHVFVEKPLALTDDELDDVLDALQTSGTPAVGWLQPPAQRRGRPRRGGRSAPAGARSS